MFTTVKHHLSLFYLIWHKIWKIWVICSSLQPSAQICACFNGRKWFPLFTSCLLWSWGRKSLHNFCTSLCLVKNCLDWNWAWPQLSNLSMRHPTPHPRHSWNSVRRKNSGNQPCLLKFLCISVVSSTTVCYRVFVFRGRCVLISANPLVLKEVQSEHSVSWKF